VRRRQQGFITLRVKRLALAPLVLLGHGAILQADVLAELPRPVDVVGGEAVCDRRQIGPEAGREGGQRQDVVVRTHAPGELLSRPVRTRVTGAVPGALRRLRRFARIADQGALLDMAPEGGERILVHSGGSDLAGRAEPGRGGSARAAPCRAVRRARRFSGDFRCVPYAGSWRRLSVGQRVFRPPPGQRVQHDAEDVAHPHHRPCPQAVGPAVQHVVESLQFGCTINLPSSARLISWAAASRRMLLRSRSACGSTEVSAPPQHG